MKTIYNKNKAKREVIFGWIWAIVGSIMFTYIIIVTVLLCMMNKDMSKHIIWVTILTISLFIFFLSISKNTKWRKRRRDEYKKNNKLIKFLGEYGIKAEHLSLEKEELLIKGSTDSNHEDTGNNGIPKPELGVLGAISYQNESFSLCIVQPDAYEENSPKEWIESFPISDKNAINWYDVKYLFLVKKETIFKPGTFSPGEDNSVSFCKIKFGGAREVKWANEKVKAFYNPMYLPNGYINLAEWLVSDFYKKFEEVDGIEHGPDFQL